MGNTNIKPHPRNKNKKQVHWRAADRPSPPGKPYLSTDNDLHPDLITIRWQKPIRDGGSPITGYLVEHRRTGSPLWARSTPLLVPFPELAISGLEPGWRYQFRVRAENAVGISEFSEISEPLTVTLQKNSIVAPKFTDELQDATALENDKIEFTVHFIGQPAPKLCWFKDGFEIFSSRRTRILTESDKSILTIHQSALADEGEIKCTATNKAGHTSTKAKLTLEAPPSIRLPRQYEDGLLFEMGEVIRLKVSVVGRPTPLIFWTHNGESVQNNDRYDIEYVDRCSVLKIDEAQRFDRGEYQIKAVNKIGEDVASFLVTVTDRPSPPGKARVVMTLGRSVTLSWGTPNDDGGCKIGNYIIEYYRLGWNMWLKAATSRQLTTILGDLIEGSEYKFRVKAESPYGVSEPSEETDVVFIPDPKRGITTPSPRSRSQPKDLIGDLTKAPVAAKRKSKAQPRSHSSTRVEVKSQLETTIIESEVPKRPERNKIKSPPKTPELSANRKTITLVTETIIDRASIARELAYGSPEIKMKKAELELPKESVVNSSSSDRSGSLSPIKKEPQSLPVEAANRSRSPTPNTVNRERRFSSAKEKSGLSRENSENLGGSSEFMLVLYPDGAEKGQRGASDINFDFEDSIPPPISLSAPELGIEPPLFDILRTSYSSSELLHERAMMRFNEAALAEETEISQRKQQFERQRSLDLPKIQINSKDEPDMVGLERRHSGRRLSASNIVQKQTLWAQRRYSLRNPVDISESGDSKLPKFTTILEKRTVMMERQRSESEEKEEKEFEKVRAKMALQGQSSFEKRSIEVVDEEKWLEEYEESLSEEEDSELSEEDERKFEEPLRRRVYSDEEEEEMYHPSSMMGRKPLSEEPFEILTKRNKLPDPSFVPKPILKKTEEKPLVTQEPAKVVRSHSPMPEFAKKPNDVLVRGRSKSLAQPTLPPINQKIIQRQRSPSLITAPMEQKPELIKEPLVPKLERDLSKVLPLSMQLKTPSDNISAVAQISGLTAASIVISEGLLKTKSEEESKVVADRYGDMVRTLSQKRRGSTSRGTSSSRETLGTSSRDSLRSDDSGRGTMSSKQDYSPSPYAVRPGETQKPTVFLEAPKAEPKPKPQPPTQPLLFAKHEPVLPPPPKEVPPVKEKSPSPAPQPSSSKPQRRSPTPQRGRSDRVLGQKRTSKRSKTPSKSPTRLENWSDRAARKSSPSPMKKPVSTLVRNKSPSPIPLARPRPMLREIMTQTSIGLEFNFTKEMRNESSSTGTERERHEELIAKAETKVRSAVDYATDLAMFIVACWLYLFSNELFAVPVLIVMVYRQLTKQLIKMIPKWILRRLKAKKKK